MIPVPAGAARSTRSVMGNRFEVGPSRIEGKGAFAIEPIKKGQLICRMEGEEISIPELKRRYKSGAERSCDPLQVRESRYLDLSEPYIFINHLCGPNAAIIRFNELVAVKDIAVGEEITYDYSLTDWPDYEAWDNYGDWFMECVCNSRLCRKKIEEWPFLPKHIQEKAIRLGVVQDYILRKFENHGK